MDYIALNARQLSCLSWHWLFGIVMDRENTETFYDLSQFFESCTLEERTKIIEDLDQMSQWPWIVRGLCWLFNIYQYRDHYYAVHSYVCLQLFLRGITMLSSEDRNNAETAGIFVVVLAAFNLMSRDIQPQMNNSWSRVDWLYHDHLRAICHSPLVYLKINARQQRERGLNLPSIQAAHRADDKQSDFIVTQSMIASLRTLELTESIGASLSFASLKSAYRMSLIRTHPDKTSHHRTEDFVAVQEAFARIEKMIQKTIPTWTTSDCFFPEYRERVIRYTEMVKILEEQAALDRIRFNSYCARVDDFCARADDFCARADDFCARVDAASVLMYKRTEELRQLKLEFQLLAARRQAENTLELDNSEFDADSEEEFESDSDRSSASDTESDCESKTDSSSPEGQENRTISESFPMHDSSILNPVYASPRENRHLMFHSQSYDSLQAYDSDSKLKISSRSVSF